MPRSKPAQLLILSSSCLLGATARAQETADKPAKSVEARLTELEQKSGGDSMRVYWKDGLRLESADKKYKFKLGGRLHYDAAFFDPDSDTKAAIETAPTTRIEDGTEFRRARIEMSGEVAERTEWAIAVDFAGPATNFRNLYAGVKDLPFGNVRAGQFKEPYGLEQQTSSNHIPFLERSLMNAFVPAFNAGVMLYDDFGGERGTWAVGAFRSGADSGEVSRGDGEWATTARVTGLPMMSEDGKEYVHVGLGLSRRSPTDDRQTIASKPEANLAPTYVTTTVATETIDLIGLEAGWTSGSLTISGEYTLAMLEGDAGTTSDPDFAGYYVQAAYLLTGESRGYKKAQGCFDAVKPAENAFGEKNGMGAVELAARLSSIDLVDDGTDGGELDDVTVGVNWYLSSNTRLMVDYTMADLDPAGAGADGDTNILAFRWQFAF